MGFDMATVSDGPLVEEIQMRAYTAGVETHRIIQESWDTENRFAEGSKLWEYVNNPVDLSFGDPPYNYGVDYDGDETRDKLPAIEYQHWVHMIIYKMVACTKKGGMLFWLCPAEHGNWVWPALEQYGWLLQGKPIIWYEKFSQYQSKRLTSDYRLLFPLVVGLGGEPTFNPDAIREESVRQQMGDKRADPRGRVPGHIWNVSRLQGNHPNRVDWHKAQLPQAPLERIVKGWTNEGDVVLDAFAGSGSLGVVCKRLSRWFVGVDQSAEYCRRIKDRMERTDATN